MTTTAASTRGRGQRATAPSAERPLPDRVQARSFGVLRWVTIVVLPAGRRWCPSPTWRCCRCVRSRACCATRDRCCVSPRRAHPATRTARARLRPRGRPGIPARSSATARSWRSRRSSWRLLIAIPGAYAIARLPFFGRRQVSALFLAAYLFPAIVHRHPAVRDLHPDRAARVAGRTGPRLHRADGAGRDLHAAQLLRDRPGRIEEAGLMDGLTRLGVLRRISLRLAMPSIMATGLFVFMIAWNEFLFALLFLVDRRDRWTVSLGLVPAVGQRRGADDGADGRLRRADAADHHHVLRHRAAAHRRTDGGAEKQPSARPAERRRPGCRRAPTTARDRPRRRAGRSRIDSDLARGCGRVGGHERNDDRQPAPARLAVRRTRGARRHPGRDARPRPIPPTSRTWPRRRFDADRLADRILGGWLGRIAGSARDDDIDYAILALWLLERHGPNFERRRVAEAMLAFLPTCGCSPQNASDAEPLTGVPLDRVAEVRNPYREWIGAMVRVDVYGWTCPGRPDRAVRRTYSDATLTHRANGVYGALVGRRPDLGRPCGAFGPGRGGGIAGAISDQLPIRRRRCSGSTTTTAAVRPGDPDQSSPSGASGGER